MPIHEILCGECGYLGEAITLRANEPVACPTCGSTQASRMISASSPLSGKTAMNLPGPRDRGCCGNSPATSGCAGPGTCCGKA